MDAGEELERTMDEYRDMFAEIKHSQKDKEDLHWELVQWKLSRIGDWTPKGAEEITKLARKYGSFILRNALAIASVLSIEDGELGYWSLSSG